MTSQCHYKYSITMTEYSNHEIDLATELWQLNVSVFAMAENLKFGDPRLSRIVEKLQRLNCPLLGGIDEWWIQELLFQPGLHRLQLIEWLLSRLNYNMLEIPQSQEFSDKKDQYFLTIVSALGLCKPGDKDLIMGQASVSEQIAFWKLFIDIVYWKNLPDHVNTDRMSESFVAKEFTKSCSFIKDIASKVSIKDLFIDKEFFLPIDVRKDVERILASRGTTEKKRLQIPTLKELKTSPDVGNLTSTNNQNFPVPTRKDVSFSTKEKGQILNEKLTLALSDLQNLSNAFDFCYDDMRPCLGKREQKLTSMGQQFKNLCHKIETISQFIDSLTTIKTVHSKLKGERIVFKQNTPCLSNEFLKGSKITLQETIDRIEKRQP